MKLVNCFRTSGGFILLALMVILPGQLADAEYVILQSATMGPTGQDYGVLVDNAQFLGARFYIDRQLDVTKIGGHITQGIPGANFFGAIVSLNSSSDLPNGYPFSAGEVVASTVFNPGYPSSDYRTPLSVTLSPGYYALVFGTNALGSWNGYGIMPFAGQTSYPQASYFVYQPSYGWFDVPSDHTRFVIEGNIVYCDASGSNLVEYQYIKGVQVGSINNIPTDNHHYADYTSLSTTMVPEVSYPVTVTRGNPWDDVYDKCGLWVDWNQDMDFSDLNEEIVMSLGVDPCTFAGTITPPAGAVLGNTRMRIRITWNETPLPCGHANYGEVEDYTIKVIEDDRGGISGIKFNDLNGNGIRNTGEPGLSGWQIYLDLNNNEQHDTGEPSTLTSASPVGQYEFSDLAPDTYTVAEVKQAGWKQTHPAVGGAHSVTVTEGATIENINFGNWQSSGSVVYLKAIEDTYADSGNPDTNYGSENSFYCGKSGSSIYQAYVKFDLSSIPPGNVVVSAALRINNDYISIPAPTLTVCRVSGDNWDESEVTWNLQPFVGGFLPTTGYEISGDTTIWDVTEDVDDDYVYDGFYSLQIRTTDISEERSASFFSKDLGNVHMAPTLEVEYAPIFGGGTGEPNDPYQIRTGEQFNSIGLYYNRRDKHYKLMANISLADYSGWDYNIIRGFQGVFDGNYHTISDFSYFATSADDNFIGLFAYVDEGTIKNLKLISPNVYINSYTRNYVGAIAGYADRADISGCSVIGGAVEGGGYVGGLVGLCEAGYIADCSSSASVSGTSKVGGLVGEGATFGGFPNINDCYAQGAVTGDNYVGGFIGDSSDVGIVNCYSTGLVSGTTDANVGGFSGYNVNLYPLEDNIIGCFWDVQSSGEPNSAAGIPLTTAQMYDENTFINAGWDFVGETDNGGSDDWAMPAGGGYPILWHELPVPPALPTFAGGSGTAGDPYLIGTEAQLNSIGHNPRLMDKHFRVISDLDLNGIKYYMIANRPYLFGGTFDGAGHTISNILLESVLDTSDVGFIGSLKGTGASIQNLTLANPNIVSDWGWGVGSLTGINENGTITNCHAVNTHVVGLTGVGGLVGVNYSYGRISGCSATGDVSENTFMSIIFSAVGGLVGENTFWSEIDNSYAKCNVTGDDCVGGLIGTNAIYGIITNCYSQGFVTGTVDYIGGLIGRNLGGTEAYYCYSSSVVTGPAGTYSVGGFVGEMHRKEYYKACFWDSEINPDVNGIGNATDPNVTGESTANMQTESTYTSAGWDFVGETVNGPNDIWDICEGMNYPKLSCQIYPMGDFVCPDGVNFFDYSFFAGHWAKDNCGPANDYCQGTDLDGDGDVDFDDLKKLAENWLASL